jgi:hypothetical protein
VPTIQQMIHCKGCERPRMHLVQRPSHLLHLVMSILTVGVWAVVVWLPLTLLSGSPRCSECGRKVGAFQFHR